ncbi:glycosyltransferase [Cohnella xylanilytica]|uniref:Glycosyltransferase n=1 Tax=Cohnella xylanilytica TaxID=557555 RepID=A0A841TNS2_9BACL|nr:glycosyltransferase [Cohnella xylanilytica]MBB6689775.1 glycosyltransferase [Cohnella xylanilytica]
MKTPSSILILTAAYGEGHLQVSEALRESLVRQGYGVRILDLFREAHPRLNALARYLYKRSPLFSSLGFDYYGWTYRITQHMDERHPGVRWLNGLGRRTLLQAVKADRPAAVVCTFPFGGVGAALRRAGLYVPVFTVITDYHLHNRWLQTQADRYYAATAELAAELKERGVDRGRIVVSGIPVRETFRAGLRRAADSESGGANSAIDGTDSAIDGGDCAMDGGDSAIGSADSAGFAPASGRKPPGTILYLSGTHATIADTLRSVKLLLRLPGIRIDVVCGRNDKLRRELERDFKREARVTVHGFVETMPELMRRASCIVTKAGGITLTEAVQAGTPLLIYKPQPGQELENARYFLAQGAARIAYNAAELTDQAARLLERSEIRERMARRYRELNGGDAAAMIADDMDRRLRPLAARHLEPDFADSYRREERMAYDG